MTRLNLTTIIQHKLSQLFTIIFQIKENDTRDVILCSNCSRPEKEATVRCLDCKEYFCCTCQTFHDGLKAMKDHTLVHVEDPRSGQNVTSMTTVKDQKCLDHDGKAKRFYCQTCEKPICIDCTVLNHRQHQRISLKDASKMQVAKLLDLVKKGEDSKKKCMNAINKTDKVAEDLNAASKDAKKKLHEIKSKYQQQLDAIFKNHETDVDLLESQRAMKLADIKKYLEIQLAKVENACELAANVTHMGSEYDIASIYPTLSASLEEIVLTTEPDFVRIGERLLGSFDEETIMKRKFLNVVSLVKGVTWVWTGQFSTFSPFGISLNQEGHVAITTKHHLRRSQAQLFSHDGSVKYTFQGPFRADLWDIAITPDNKYVLPGESEILFYDGKGNRLEYPKAVTYGLNNKPSGIRSLAVDIKGRIIVGLEGNTISIHHPDGRVLFKFATHAQTHTMGLGVTSKGNIAATFLDCTLKVMDYSGNIVKVVKPPQAVSLWKPGSICCSNSNICRESRRSKSCLSIHSRW